MKLGNVIEIKFPRNNKKSLEKFKKIVDLGVKESKLRRKNVKHFHGSMSGVVLLEIGLELELSLGSSTTTH